MLRKFYEKVLPTQGVYCVTGIDTSVEPSRAKNYFCETLEDVFETLEKVKAKEHNTFVALSSFDGHTRKADNAIYSRSFFIDLDVGESKEYSSKEEALGALSTFLESTGLPEPNRVDSGRGIHAYWVFEEDVPIEEWKVYAEKFKSFCLDNGLHIDKAVTADAARILRAPDTYNYKENPPLETRLIDEEIYIYQFQEFKEFLGEVAQSLESIIELLPKGDLTDEEKSFRKLDNFDYTFERIAIRSLEGDGCAQIEEILTRPNDISYDMWAGGLTIAVKCSDGETAIHKMSEDYEGYSYDATVKKAYHSGLEGPRTCDWFANENPSKCAGCKHRGKISTPLALGKALKIATQPSEVTVHTEKTERPLWTPPSSFTLPGALFPYARGVNGGIYLNPPPIVDKKTGAVTQSEPVLVSQYDIYPIRRIDGGPDGACLVIRAEFPNDAPKEFLLPTKHIYSQEKFKEILASNNVLFSPIGNGVNNLMNYFYKWGVYLTDNHSAEIMRNHFGWTDKDKKDVFVVGGLELRRDGTEISAPISPLCHNITKHLKSKGSFDEWKASVNKLNNESMELHAFVMLAGFGSVLMPFTNTNGVTLALSGRSGGAKTGALYTAMSIWGSPKDLSIATAQGGTANALNHRYSILGSLPYGLDEVTEMDPRALASLVSRISFGSAKVKLQGSVNAEREVDSAASLIAIMTANGDLYDKLKGYKLNPEGEVARLIEFKLSHDPEYLKKNPEAGPAIFEPLHSNYGWAGPEFIRILFKYTEAEIKAMIERWLERFRKDFGHYGPYRYYDNLVAVTMVAGELLNKHGILDLNLERIYRTILAEMTNIKDGVVKISDVDYESLIGEFINSYQRSVLQIKDGKTGMEPSNGLVIRVDMDKSLISIERAVFNKHLAEKQVSSREFKANLMKNGINIEEKKVRLGSGWKDATGVFNVWCYVIDSTFILDRMLEENADQGT